MKSAADMICFYFHHVLRRHFLGEIVYEPTIVPPKT